MDNFVIRQMCVNDRSFSRHFKFLVTYDVAKEKQLVEFANGIHMLSATPPSLLRLVETKVTDFRRCCHLVFDCAEDIFR